MQILYIHIYTTSTPFINGVWASCSTTLQLQLQSTLLRHSRLDTDRPPVRSQIKHDLIQPDTAIGVEVERCLGRAARRERTRAHHAGDIDDGAPCRSGDATIISAGRLEAGGVEADA